MKHSANFLKNAKSHHKFICANDNIALRGGKSSRAAPRFCGRLLEKNKRGKTPRPNSWTEASAPAANRAEREHRRKGAQSAAPHRQPPHFHPAPPKLCAKQICAHSWHEERTAETLPNRPHRFPRPGVHPAAPLLLLAVFPINGAAKTAHPLAPLRGGKSPRAAPRFCWRLLEKTSAAKLRARIVGQSQAPRRRTERSESAAHSRARRPAAFRARRTPCRAVFCSPLLRTAGRKKARPGGRAFSERSSQICALE